MIEVYPENVFYTLLCTLKLEIFLLVTVKKISRYLLYIFPDKLFPWVKTHHDDLELQ